MWQVEKLGQLSNLLKSASGALLLVMCCECKVQEWVGLHIRLLILPCAQVKGAESPGLGSRAVALGPEHCDEKSLCSHATKTAQQSSGSLNMRTLHGRPHFPSIFAAVQTQPPTAHVGVFYCGPTSMGQTLSCLSRKLNATSDRCFVFHMERFN